jgi:hypothetical protein
MRAGETEWKHKLNDIIRKRQKDIYAILTSYGVPLASVEAAPIQRGPDDAPRPERSGPQ